LGLDKPLVLADVAKANKLVGLYNYTDVMDRLVFQPSNMNVTYKDLMPVLRACHNYMTEIEAAMTTVSVSLTNISDGKGVSVYSASALNASRAKIEPLVQKAFNGKETTEAVFSTRFKSMVAYKSAYVEFNEFIQSLLRRNTKNVRINVDRIAELAGFIYSAIEQGELTMKPNEVKAMADLLLQLARAVDLYAVLTTLIIATGTALNNTADKLLPAVK